ncbi:hypothetical protein [Streptomyces sp. NPDC001100]
MDAAGGRAPGEEAADPEVGQPLGLIKQLNPGRRRTAAAVDDAAHGTDQPVPR